MFKFLVEEIDNREKNAERIAYFEQKYGIVFPDILKELYARTNDGILKECKFQIDGFTFGVWQLVSLDGDRKFNFEFIADDDRDERFEGVFDDWYPLAYDRGAATYYWNSKTHEICFVIDGMIEESADICNSIEEFIELLNNSIVEE